MILEKIYPENYNSIAKMNELAMFSDDNYQPKYYQLADLKLK